MDLKTVLAYGMLWWILVSVYYMAVTRDIGTPLRDSLTQQQLEIKKKSRQVRQTIFCQGALLTTLITYILYTQQVL